MSSYVRTLQKRIMKAKGVSLIPVLNAFAKNVVVNHVYPHTRDMLAITSGGERIFHPDDCTTPRERAIVELLHNDRQAAA